MREIVTQPLLLGMNLVTLIGLALMLLGTRTDGLGSFGSAHEP
jgi:hypothetical protein